MKKKLTIIDGNNFAFPCILRRIDECDFNALTDQEKSEFIEKTKTKISYKIHDVIESTKTSHILFVFDGKDNMRKKIFPIYKGHRKAKEFDYKETLAILKEYLVENSLPFVESDNGYEGDDLIYTASEICKWKNIHLNIVSTDQDYHFLLDDNIEVYSLMMGKYMKRSLYTQESFIEEQIFSSRYLKFYKILFGDSSDFIPGVPRLRKDKIKELINMFGVDSVEKLIDFHEINKGEKEYKKIVSNILYSFMEKEYKYDCFEKFNKENFNNKAMKKYYLEKNPEGNFKNLSKEDMVKLYKEMFLEMLSPKEILKVYEKIIQNYPHKQDQLREMIAEIEAKDEEKEEYLGFLKMTSILEDKYQRYLESLSSNILDDSDEDISILF